MTGGAEPGMQNALSTPTGEPMKLAHAVFACTLLLSQFVQGAEIAGHTLPDTVQRFDRTFRLSGCGLRELLFSDIYLLGLYLEEPGSTLADIADAGTGKIYILRVLYKGDLPEDLPDAWREPLATQLSTEYLDILQDLYDRVENGDTVEFRYLPGRREEIRINGGVELRETDTALVPALTRLWLGEDAVSGNLKRLLLKGTCD